MSVWEDSEWGEEIDKAPPEALTKPHDVRAFDRVEPMTGPFVGVYYYRPRYPSYPPKQFDQDGKEPR